ncbi:MAG: GAF domain-containing protein [Anaerolineae bacterium]
MHVLVVDDELSIRETFQAFLEEEGYDVTTAADFFEAELLLADHPCDVVVADIILPRVDGLSLLRRVREIDEDILVIMVTGEPDVATAVEAVRHGAYDYIAKPVTQEVLTRVVGRAVEKKHLLDEKRRLEVVTRAYRAELEERVAERTAELEQRNRQLTALIEIGRDISATLDLTEVLKRVTQRAAQACGAHRCTILLLGEDGETLIPLMSQFSDGHVDREMWRVFKEARYPTPMGQVPEAQRVIRERRPLFIPDAPASSLPSRLIEPFGIKSVLLVPLVSKERVVGLMVLDRVEEGREFAAEQVDLAMAIAAQAAIAAENARLYEEAGRHVDELTALHNIDVAITSVLNPDEVLQVIYEQVSEVMRPTTFYIGLYDEERDEIYLPLVVEEGERLPPILQKGGEEGGLSYWVVRNREPLWIDDMDKERDTLPVKPVSFGIHTHSLMLLPLIVKDEVVGVISVQSKEPYAFDEGHRKLFSGIASQVAIAMENARLFEETNRRLAETRLLQEVIRAAASTLDFDEVLTRTIETLHKTLDINYLTFVLPDEQGTDLVVHPSWIGYPSVDVETRIPMDRSVCGRVYRSGEPQILPDVREVPYYFETAPEVRSELAVPVNVAGRVIAVLDVESSRLEAFGKDDLRLFSAVAAQLGVVLENARLFEETKRRLAESRLIQEVMLAATSTLDFDLVLERTVKALHRALGIDRLGFLLPDEQGGALVPHPSLVGFAEASFQIPIDGTLVGRVYRTGQPVLVRDLAQQPAYLEHAPEVRSVLAVSVWVGDRIAAVLHAESPQVGGFGEDELRLFTTIAGQLGVTLENARLYRELQEINRLRTELVQNVGHELRTPLGLIKGYVELLLEGDLGPILDGQRSALQIVHERTATLSRLIHNLTVLQTLPCETRVLVSVVEVMQHVLVEFRRSAEEAGITFVEELQVELPPVLGDREQLALAFSHLVDNAIKFSPDGGTVTIRAWADQEVVRVSIADEGIGISAEYLDRIFERFYQVNGTARRRFGGMGVGLALVLEIVEAHGGTVRVESEPGKGSTFTVTLPQAT